MSWLANTSVRLLPPLEHMMAVSWLYARMTLVGCLSFSHVHGCVVCRLAVPMLFSSCSMSHMAVNL